MQIFMFTTRSIALTLWSCLLSSLFWLGCEKKDATTDNFSRKELLSNVANNLIIPNFTALKTQTDALQTAVSNLNSTPNAANLTIAQAAFEQAYLAWLHCSMFNFGPAELPVFGTLAENIGLFPVNTLKIENLIAANNTNFNNFDRDTRGFLALDYLLFDLNNNATNVLNALQNPNRRAYVLAVANDLKNKIDKVNTDWATYKDTFINNDGTDAGSSVSILFNEFTKNYESIKNFKVGVPAGKRVGQIAPEPTRVEAYYAGLSVKFLKEHLRAIENVWFGKDRNGKDGVGFEEYLQAVSGGAELVSSTKTQWANVVNITNNLPNSRLSDQLRTDLPRVEAVFTEMQKHTRYFKSDMSSLLGIAITYSSGDGD